MIVEKIVLQIAPWVIIGGTCVVVFMGAIIAVTTTGKPPLTPPKPSKE